MRDKIIDKTLKFVNKYMICTQEKNEILKYGLTSIYILISKSIVIFMVAFLLNIGIEVIIFALIYNLMRMPSFGLHATKSWICLVSSLIIFICIPFICKTYNFNIYMKVVLGIILICRIYMNAPADTYKRPIISKARRDRYKFISTTIAIVLIFISLLINNNFISNCCLFAVLLQSFMISPYIYKLFKLPYNNYLGYIKEMA